MKNDFNKSFSLTLAVLITLVSGVSCGSAASNDTTASTSAAATDSSAAVTTVEKAEIPDKSYDDYDFRVLCPRTTGNLATSEEVATEEQNGETLNDALYTRNKAVEDKLGVKIKKIDSDNVPGDYSKSVLASDDAYDAVLDTISSHVAAITSGYSTDISALTYIDTDKSWWNKDMIDSSTIANKSFLLFGDINFWDKNSTWALVFNKTLAKENNLEEPYDVVKSGEWTIDKLEEQCKGITKDINGDSVLDKNDQWGLLSSDTASIGFVTSCDIKTVSAEKNGELKFNLDTERNIAALSKIYKFFANGDLQLRAEAIGGASKWTDIVNIFKEGRALYRVTILGDVTTMRDMQDDFGILPLPKLDETQADYYTTYQAWSGRAYAVPITADPERTSAILEYMASVSPDTLTKAYYDVTLQRKVARDDESSDMLDIIFDSLTTDIGLAFELGGVRSTIVEIMRGTSDTVASTLASQKSAITDSINSTYESIKGK